MGYTNSVFLWISSFFEYSIMSLLLGIDNILGWTYLYLFTVILGHGNTFVRVVLGIRAGYQVYKVICIFSSL